jgi:3-isopropylmalate dehydrogenase
VLQVLARGHGLHLAWHRLAGGAAAYPASGTALSEDALRTLERADAILFGAMDLPDDRYPDATEIAPGHARLPVTVQQR